MKPWRAWLVPKWRNWANDPEITTNQIKSKCNSNCFRYSSLLISLVTPCVWYERELEWDELWWSEMNIATLIDSTNKLTTDWLSLVCQPFGIVCNLMLICYKPLANIFVSLCWSRTPVLPCCHQLVFFSLGSLPSCHSQNMWPILIVLLSPILWGVQLAA